MVSTLACLSVPLMQMPVSAADSSIITIEKPEGWKNGDTVIHITIDGSKISDHFSISKMEAKIGTEGAWKDITEKREVTISGNTTVYIRVTDAEGNVYEQNRSIVCYDNEKPTLTASLTDGVLTIKGYDNISGIGIITVNGNDYSELTDDGLKVQLTQSDFKTKKIEITATDQAGNVSAKYALQNPYYDWAVKLSKSLLENASGNSNVTATTINTSTDSMGSASSENVVSSPLPQNVTASEPTEARGTVTEETVSRVEEDTGETVETVTQTGSEGEKRFYTISTKSGKIFYLIVDNSKETDNVYFLTEVDEQDLMNFTLSDTVTLPDVDTVYAEIEEEEGLEQSETEETEDTKALDEPQMPEVKTSVGGYILIVLAALGIAGAGWYFKVYKPKHEIDEEDEYEGEEAEEEEYETEIEYLDDEDEIPEEDEEMER